jgi:hypothetical protein
VNLLALHGMSTESLMKLKAEVNVILAKRLDTELRIGAEITFNATNGETVTIIVEKINGKTVSGRQVGGIRSGIKWRVGKGMFTVKPTVKVELQDLLVPHKPSAGYEGAW